MGLGEYHKQNINGMASYVGVGGQLKPYEKMVLYFSNLLQPHWRLVMNNQEFIRWDTLFQVQAGLYFPPVVPV